MPVLNKPKTNTKKIALGVAIAAQLSTSAAFAQQHVNSENTGSVLLYPFYNVENSNDTYVHVSNTTAESKAVKVRFMEARNSSVVLEFNVYLGPYDIFPLAITQVGDGAAVLTNDASCTVPALGTANGNYDGTQVELADGAILRTQPFVPYQYASEAVSGLGRTLKGHAEVIEMGVVDSSIDVADCEVISKLWSDGAWTLDTSTDVTGPTGGLSGSSIYINPGKAFSMNVDVTTIDGWAKPATNYHAGPGTLLPTLNQGISTATVFDGTDYVTLDYTKQTDGGVLATSAVLATQSVFNEVQTEVVIAAETDWVMTFPTKKYFTNATSAAAPFTEAYDSKVETDTACETVNLTRFDRSSNKTTGSGTFVPEGSGVDGELCGNVSVMSFHPNSALGVADTTAVDYPYGAGAATVEMTQELPADDNGVSVVGLPVIGFAGTRIVNGAMSYGYAQQHKTLTITSGGI